MLRYEFVVRKPHIQSLTHPPDVYSKLIRV